MIWCGAGLSRSAGLPTWRELKEYLEERADAKLQTMKGGPEKDRLLHRVAESRRTGDYWRAFELLRNALGETTYRSLIRERLSTRVSPPEVYRKIWQMRIRGVLSLNIDKFASRAFSEVHPGGSLNEFSGKNASNYLHLLASSSPIVANLHGAWDDHSSWIFTKGALTNLLGNVGYQTFIRSVLATHAVVFLGVSADDVAAGGFLERLLKEDKSVGCGSSVTT
jgi:hypothetical protein